ncbi:hypothetical protein BGZ92_002087, partial [Podila epicladia]
NEIDLHPSKSLSGDGIVLNSQLDHFTLSLGCNDQLSAQGNWSVGVQYPGFPFCDWSPAHTFLPMPGSTFIYSSTPSHALNYHSTIFSASVHPLAARAQQTSSSLNGAIISKRNDDIAIKIQGGYQCAYPGCPKVYAQKYSIKRHRETVHVKPDARISCPEKGCNRTFGYFRELNRHHSKAHGDKCHHCPCLNKWFSRLYLLRGQCPQGALCPGAVDRRKSSNTT